jgi:hypothetical protein
MTKVLKKLAEEGIQITPDILASLSPYRTSHINRFGDYTLDLQRKIAPLEFETRILPNQEMEENS